MPVKTGTDEIVVQAINGDIDALGELFSIYKDDIYYYALKLVGNEFDAMDVLQDTMIEIFKSIDRLQEPSYFKTWALTICHRVCLKHFNKSTKYKFDTSIDDDDSFINDIEDEDLSILPQEVIESQELHDSLESILDELPPQQKESIMLYYYSEMSVAEITEIMDCPAGTVKSNLNYARKKVRKGVEAHEEKYNVKLHSINAGPIIIWLLRQGTIKLDKDKIEAVYKIVCASSGVAATAASATVSTATTSIATKIIASTLATTIIGIGGYIVTKKLNPNPKKVYSNTSLAVSANVSSEEVSSAPVIADKKKLNKKNEPRIKKEQASHESTKAIISSMVSKTSSIASSKITRNTESNATSSNKSSKNTNSKPKAKYDEDGEKYFERINENFTYNYYEDHIVLTSFVGNKSEVSIPEEIDGVEVVEIADSCFMDNDTITKVIIDASIDTIGSYAFYGCDSLKNVIIGSNVLIIHNSAFANCQNLKTVHFYGEECDIGENVFVDCASGFTIYGSYDSDAEIYANEYDYKFVEN